MKFSLYSGDRRTYSHVAAISCLLSHEQIPWDKIERLVIIINNKSN